MKLPRIPYGYLAITPFALMGLGFIMNAIVMAANGGQMPVQFPGGCAGGDFGADDMLHMCMTSASHLKFLADWIVIKDVGIASPGDFLEWAYSISVVPSLCAWIALIIRKHNAT